MLKQIVTDLLAAAILKVNFFATTKTVAPPPRPSYMYGLPTAAPAKVADPQTFNGDKDEFDEFRMRLAIKFSANADHYPSEKTKVAYTFSLLADKALQQVQHWLDPTTTSITCPDVSTLLEALNSAFGNPYRKSTAQHFIRNLRQNNKTFTDYYASFSREIGYCNYGDKAKKSALIAGLSSELLEKLED